MGVRRTVAVVVAVLLVVPALLATAAHAAEDDLRALTWNGLSLDVPSSWPVVDLAENPRTCVRFDVHAVYLGVPGQEQDCPVGVVGRTEAILLQPADQTADHPRTVVDAGSAPAVDDAALTQGQLSVVVAGSSTWVLAPFGAEPELVRSIIASAHVTDPAAAAPGSGQRAAGTQLAPAAAAAAVPNLATKHSGLGFDACTAPSMTAIQRWLASPYRAVGIYIGGASRGCAQPNLTAAWVQSTFATGFRMLPLYVGLQAPCSAYTNRIVPGQEVQQGQAAAVDAAARAQALGFGAGSDIYFDMESYSRGGACTASVMAFLSAWSSTVRSQGFRSGVYSSAATGVADVVQSVGSPGFAPPDTIWFARWNGQPTIYGEPQIPDAYWNPYQRIHQYLGGHDETHGGVTINIDSNVVDTDPSRGNPFGAIDVMSTSRYQVQIKGWALDPDTTGPTGVYIYLDGASQAFNANQNLPGVNNAFPGYGDDHGYTATMPASPGPHQVCVNVYNIGPGQNSTLGCRTVVVP